MIKFVFLPFLLFIGLCLLPCRPLLASVCGDDTGYPDQYPYKNCGGVSTLSWDQENSCEELEDNASCAVAVTGGQGPYTWTISGTGFHFLDNHTRVQTSSPEIDVFTEDACGAGSITVTDACGAVVDSAVRSTDGEWSLVEENEPANIETVGRMIPADGYESPRYIAYEAQYRITQAYGYGSNGHCANCSSPICIPDYVDEHSNLVINITVLPYFMDYKPTSNGKFCYNWCDESGGHYTCRSPRTPFYNFPVRVYEWQCQDITIYPE